jgi:HSP20 family protein
MAEEDLFSEKPLEETSNDSGDAGALAIDSWETTEEVVIRAPLAGVKPEDLDLTITENMVTIKGSRHDESEVTKDNFFVQECYWGSFERTYKLPVSVDAERAKANLKNGILTIRLPKLEQTKTKNISVESIEE